MSATDVDIGGAKGVAGLHLAAGVTSETAALARVREIKSGGMFGNNVWPTCSTRPGDSSLADLAERAGVAQVWRTWLKGPGSSKSVNQVQGSAAESPGNYRRFPDAP